MKIFAFTITRADTSARAAVLNTTLWNGIESAGLPFDWWVWANNSGPLALAVLEEAHHKGVLKGIHKSDENVGQHVAWNAMFKMALDGGYDYFLRIDDDCQFVTKRWLKRLHFCSVVLDDRFVLAPCVRGLKNPPRKSKVTYVKGIPLEFLVEAIGGICRLHPVALLAKEDDPFIADVRKPLGSGDATGIATWCRKHSIPMAYCRQVRVRHNTVKQEEDDPSYFIYHDLWQTVPYIPLEC
jgi:GT2 family glycosyltransferase